MTGNNPLVAKKYIARVLVTAFDEAAARAQLATACEVIEIHEHETARDHVTSGAGTADVLGDILGI